MIVRKALKMRGGKVWNFLENPSASRSSMDIRNNANLSGNVSTVIHTVICIKKKIVSRGSEYKKMLSKHKTSMNRLQI